MKAPSVSDSEWTVVAEVWKKEGQTSIQIASQLPDPTKWKLKTVNTFLTRLVNKGVLRTEKAGRAFRYFSNVPREQCIDAESASFLQRVFGGAVVPLVAYFCETANLSEDEIAELRKILSKKTAPVSKPPAAKPPKPAPESDQLSLL